MPYLTRQEMYNRAYIGLRSQNFSIAYDKGCQYSLPNGNHCAWGWVDTSIPHGTFGSVGGLFDENTALTREILDPKDVGFAENLQRCHDEAAPADGVHDASAAMIRNLLNLAIEYNLTVPD